MFILQTIAVLYLRYYKIIDLQCIFNQRPKIKEGKKIQWQKDKRTNNDLHNITQKDKN